MALNVQLCRTCRHLSRQWRVVRRLTSGEGKHEEAHVGVSESISRHIIQAGFNRLKSEDISILKENAVARAASLDFDKLVNTKN